MARVMGMIWGGLTVKRLMCRRQLNRARHQHVSFLREITAHVN